MSIEGFKIEPTLLLLAILTLALLVGLRSRTRKSGYYLLAGRSIGPMGIGAAIASNWMSAASFLGIAGVFYLQGYMAFAYVVGWTGGYVLLLILMATQIRRFGKYTAAEFVEARYDSAVARCLAAVITILISLIYCVAQYKGIALVFSWMFGLDYSQSLFLGTTVVLGYLVLSGSLGAIRNQPFLCAIVLLAFIVPLMCLSKKLGFDGLFPQTEYGRALADLTPLSGKAPLAPWIHCTPYEWIALCFTLMVGTVGLPHVLSRFYTVP
ncbi:MAG: cation acetate symporter, partial [Desulfuromonadaceae bacterium]